MDEKVEVIIFDILMRVYFDILLIVEEVCVVGYMFVMGFGCFFFVDLFDGMKEFINKSEDFIVNIVLIVDGWFVVGVVYVFVKGVFY